MNEHNEAIGVIGIGWVGLVTAACFADLGRDVVAMDVDEEKVRSLGAGEVTIHEPGIEELLERNRERLTYTTSMEDVLERCRLLFCCVDTPPTYSGDADLSSVQAVVAGVKDEARHALVMKSTVPAGTGVAIRRSHASLAYVSCPEFLREGSAVYDFMHPDRVVIGADEDDEWAADAVTDLYRPLGGELVRTDVASAEMIKLASNAFLATKISFINEIANVSEEVGADVTEVARGMGLDRRIGASFLQAGIGYGGSCLAGEETVLVRRGDGPPSLTTFTRLFAEVAVATGAPPDAEVLYPDDMSVLSWDGEAVGYHPVGLLTRRRHRGELLQVRTKMGRRIRCTPDHPFVVRDGEGNAQGRKLAGELTTGDWIPLADEAPPLRHNRAGFSFAGGVQAANLEAEDVIVRPASRELAALAALPVETRRAQLEHPRGHSQRFHDITRTGALRLHEALALRVSLAGASGGTARNGTYVPLEFPLDEAFWRVGGMYIAEGHCSVDGDHERHRLQWSFHPEAEDELVGEVRDYWERLGVKATVRQNATTKSVQVSSKVLARWWLDRLGMGANSYEQRIPDLAWSQPPEHKRALLAGMWLGDGSWSFVNRGPSVILEYGTASPELADGALRLLGELGIVASMRIGRTAKSTCDNYWLRISGAEQVERAGFLVPQEDRERIEESVARQAKRIAPTGFRAHPGGVASVRVVAIERERFDGPVYSLEVPGPHTVVATGGLVTSNCFPKDVSALKQLAGNSGYHFQLLTSVIEVNELQKRRVMKKLERHLDSLVGRNVALLGLAFKPDTDDMREASSLVLAARLQGEGALVRAYDPVAEARARELLPQVEFAASAEEAFDGADAVILVTEWSEFAELDWEALAGRMSTPLIIDGRNFLDPERLREAGFIYEGIGRPAAA